jgi:hypothetical protein
MKGTIPSQPYPWGLTASYEMVVLDELALLIAYAFGGQDAASEGDPLNELIEAFAFICCGLDQPAQLYIRPRDPTPEGEIEFALARVSCQPPENGRGLDPAAPDGYRDPQHLRQHGLDEVRIDRLREQEIDVFVLQCGLGAIEVKPFPVATVGPAQSSPNTWPICRLVPELFPCSRISSTSPSYRIDAMRVKEAGIASVKLQNCFVMRDPASNQSKVG